MIDELCRTCRFCHLDESPEQKVYADVETGILWWRKVQRKLTHVHAAYDNSQCWRFPRTEQVEADWWCGEWQPTRTMQSEDAL